MESGDYRINSKHDRKVEEDDAYACYVLRAYGGVSTSKGADDPQGRSYDLLHAIRDGSSSCAMEGHAAANGQDFSLQRIQ